MSRKIWIESWPGTGQIVVMHFSYYLQLILVLITLLVQEPCQTRGFYQFPVLTYIESSWPGGFFVSNNVINLNHREGNYFGGDVQDWLRVQVQALRGKVPDGWGEEAALWLCPSGREGGWLWYIWRRGCVNGVINRILWQKAVSTSVIK